MLLDVATLHLLLPILSIELYPFDCARRESLFPVIDTIDGEGIAVRVRPWGVKRADPACPAEHVHRHLGVELVAFEGSFPFLNPDL